MIATSFTFGDGALQSSEGMATALSRGISPMRGNSRRLQKTALSQFPQIERVPWSKESLPNLSKTYRLKPASTALKPLKALRGGATILSSSVVSVPPNWLFPALACATSYALYNLFIKQAATAKMDPILGGVILQVVAAAMGALLWLAKRASVNGATEGMMVMTKTGLLWSIAAGVAVGAAELLSFIVSGKGVPATQSIPVIVGGSIVVGTVLGSFWLKERLTRTGWLGVLLIAAGIALVGKDPGSAMGH